MSNETPVLDVLDALLALPGDAAEFAGFEISDGSPLETEKSYYAVGFNGNEEAESIRSEVLTIDPGMGMSEHTEVDFQLSVWSGDYAPRTVREQAYGALNRLNTLLAADKTLGKTCTKAYVVRHSCIQTPISEGSTATINGTFSILAWRKP